MCAVNGRSSDPEVVCDSGHEVWAAIGIWVNNSRHVEVSHVCALESDPTGRCSGVFLRCFVWTNGWTGYPNLYQTKAGEGEDSEEECTNADKEDFDDG